MTDEVAALVLRNNYLQTLALSLARAARPRGHRLPAAADADAGAARRARPRVEYLPDDMAIAERAGARSRSPGRSSRCCSPTPSCRCTTSCSNLDGARRSLSRPRAVALFPAGVGEAFPDALEQHRLRREIIATQLANSMINRGGPSLVVRIADQTGATVRRDRRRLRGGAQQLRHAGAQRRDQRARQQGARQGAARAVRGGAEPAARPPGLVPAQRRPVARAGQRGRALPRRASRRWRRRSTALPPEARRRAQARAAELDKAGVPEALARRIADLPDARRSARHRADRRPHRQKPIAGDRRDLFRRRGVLPARPHRAADARRSWCPTISTGSRSTARSTRSASRAPAHRRDGADGQSGTAAVEAWAEPRAAEVERIRAAIRQIAGGGLTLSKLSVAASLLGRFGEKD